MGVDPFSLAMMGMAVAGTVAKSAQANSQQKQIGKIQSAANAETDAMRAKSAAEAAEGRAKSEEQRAAAEDIWRGTVGVAGRPDLERRMAEGTEGRKALYASAIGRGAGVPSMIPEAKFATTKGEQALQLGDALGKVRADLAARAKLAGTDEGFREQGRVIDESGRRVMQMKDLAAGTARTAGQTQALIGEAIQGRQAQADRAKGYLADAQPKFGIGDALMMGGQLGGMAGASGALGSVLPAWATTNIGTTMARRATPANLTASLKGMTM